MEEAVEKPGIVLRAAGAAAQDRSWTGHDGPVSIGSWEGASLCLPDERILPVHAVLDPHGDGRWLLLVLDSEGCKLNGRQVRRAIVQDGDRIQLGPYEVQVELAAGALAPNQRDAKALEARLFWKGTLLDTRVLRPGEPLVVGQGRGTTFRLPPDSIGAQKGSWRRRWLVASDIQGWHVALDSPLRATDPETGAPLLTTSIRNDGPKAPRGCEKVSTWTPVPAPSGVRLESSELAIELRPCSANLLVRRRRDPFLAISRAERVAYAILLFLFFLAVLNVEIIHPFRPESAQIKVAELITQFQRPDTVSKEEKERISRWTRKIEKEQEAEGSAAKAKGEEGRAGRPDAPDANRRRAGPKSDAELVKEHELLKALSGTGTNLAGGGALGAASALGNLDGPSVGDSKGTLGLGMAGSGQGGGGLSTDSVGVGDVDAKGTGFGRGVGGLGGVAKSELGIDEPATVQGGLDREVIRRVILSHRVQIRYCYEKQLASAPDLAGKVLIEFVIGADGKVNSARVAEESIADPEVGRCIASKVRTWTFPKPKGGGVVVVTYPFLFKPLGGGK